MFAMGHKKRFLRHAVTDNKTIKTPKHSKKHPKTVILFIKPLRITLKNTAKNWLKWKNYSWLKAAFKS